MLVSVAQGCAALPARISDTSDPALPAHRRTAAFCIMCSQALEPCNSCFAGRDLTRLSKVCYCVLRSVALLMCVTDLLRTCCGCVWVCGCQVGSRFILVSPQEASALRLLLKFGRFCTPLCRPASGSWAPGKMCDAAKGALATTARHDVWAPPQLANTTSRTRVGALFSAVSRHSCLQFT